MKFLEGKFVIDKLDNITSIFNNKFETVEVDGQKKTKLKEALTMDECQYVWLELWKLKNDMVTTLSAEYPELGVDK